ncbi:MAG: archease, partial [Dehalococcoidales bacterium]
MKREFEIFDHTADVGVVAYGNDASEAFASAARGLFSLITDPGSIQEITWRDTELVAPDEESLLVDWLNELIYLFDVEKLIFRRFEVDIFPGFVLK